MGCSQSAVLQANQIIWNYASIREHALNFSEQVFFEKVIEVIHETYFGKTISSIVRPKFMSYPISEAPATAKLA